MALLVELSGEQLDLAGHEAWAAASILSGEEVEVLWSDGPALVLDAPGVKAPELARRLGLAHHVCGSVISGPVDAAARLAGSVDVGEARSFRVRVRRTDVAPGGPGAKELEAEGGLLVQHRTGMSVDLQDPDVEVRVLIARRAYAGLLEGSVDRSGLESRAVRHRPFSQPVSIHPKFARAMVNLSRGRPGATILDPFCGTGGMLIEAAILGYRVVGTDIDPRMVNGSRRNLAALDLQARLTVSDVADVPVSVDDPVSAIVTDPPYGRSTIVHGHDPASVMGKLYSTAEASLPEGGRLVVCLPSEGMLPPEGGPLVLESSHSIRVHRSLTRHICVLRK